MQGDYMALRFEVGNHVNGSGNTGRPDGHVVWKIDARGVGSYAREYDGAPLAADEVRLRYRRRDGVAKVATNAFFFEEGTADTYAGARFGELRVDPGGDAILTGLRGP